MSSGATVNVLRYSALGLGIFYGFYHQRRITTTQRAVAAKQEYEHKKSLIEQAKAEYSKAKNPPAPAAASTSGLDQDPMDAKFDLEAYFEALMKQKP
ncbi:ATPase, F0 complex, subunit E, mitochondrial [Niveomyces insectorum RCEF 264]|uniref:ATP synthase F(0) complex subunit e, mitochondrial n=1 Tax=Niveomyces insectorum RCEF 264 TaxID=1081102 RepID=A0A167PE05_9HYPO|nr:ATPase, F0 complex, subunit E, mitochondrial [Niveomyces insectorum RCEF 264]